LRRRAAAAQPLRALFAGGRRRELARVVQLAPRMEKTPIRDFMTPAPFTIGADQPLTIASELMRARRIRHLPVLRGGQLVGILSQRDIQLIAGLPAVDLAEVPVEDAMSNNVYSVSPDTPVAEVAAEMAAHKYGAALVVEGKHIAGVFTTVDALHLLAKRPAARAPRRKKSAR
jgi:acetoin utilization protein AcuB